MTNVTLDAVACVLEEHIEGHKGDDGQQELSQHLPAHAVVGRVTAVVLGLQGGDNLRFLLGHLLTLGNNVVACQHQLAAVAELRQAALQLEGRAGAVEGEAGHQDAVAQQSRW